MRLWFEEELEEDLRWVFGVESVLGKAVSKYQDIDLVESGPFGKVLLLDGKLQSAEADEFVYHEALVHPPLLAHANPQRVFIMGGGEGSAAREVLRHRGVERVVMCDIDEEVVKFCREHLTVNTEAFANERLNLIINDAGAELLKEQEAYDVIIADLADPVAGGPCFQLYTKAFYADVVKRRLRGPRGVFVTQAGPAGILTAEDVFTPICNTLRQVFRYVKPYTAHIPSYADTWGWVMASDEPFDVLDLREAEIEQKLGECLLPSLLAEVGAAPGEAPSLRYFDGATLRSLFVLNKPLQRMLANETKVYTEDAPLFVHGHGMAETRPVLPQPTS